MPVEFIWENDERTILRHRYFGEVTLDHYYFAIEENFRLIDQYDHTVHIINHQDDVTKRPPNMLQVLRKLNQYKHERQGVIVLVSSSAFSFQLAKLARIFAPKTTENLYIVRSLDEAMALLKDHTDTSV